MKKKIIKPLFFLFLIFSYYYSNGQNKELNVTDIINCPWVFKVNFLGTPYENIFTFKLINGKLKAISIDGDTSSIIKENDKIILNYKESDSSNSNFSGRFTTETGRGEMKYIDTSTPRKVNSTVSFEAYKMKINNLNTPRKISIIPSKYFRTFSYNEDPLIHIWPGDSIHTETIDAAGTDKNGVTKSMGGNPLTGPFYIESALPGDVLAITITKLKPNRDWAISDQSMINRSITNSYYKKVNPSSKMVRWKLDTIKNLATPMVPYKHMKEYSVPLKPMLGCIGVAFLGYIPSVFSGDSGPFGGNLDFKEISEGATVYLPINKAGAYLYLGDAHALQGDGEINQDALETSMDVDFTTKIIKKDKMQLSNPRVENQVYRMSIGLGGSLEEAVKKSTSDLANWIAKDYHLSDEETAEILGTSIEYTISEIADRNVGVVAKIKKEFLDKLKD